MDSQLKPDWILLGVRAAAGLIAVAILAAIKVVVDIPTIPYVAGLVTALVIGLAILWSLRKKTSQSTTVEPNSPILSTVSTFTQTSAPAVQAVDDDDTAEIPIVQPAVQAPQWEWPRPKEPKPPPRVYRRHWKMAVPMITTVIAVAVLVIGATLWFSHDLTGLGVPDTYLMAIIVVTTIVAGYLVVREVYRYRHSPIILHYDRVTFKQPDCVWLLYFGSSMSLSLADVSLTKVKERTPIETLPWFRHVRTITIDSPAERDTGAHGVTNVINGEELTESVTSRKTDLEARVYW